MSKREVTQKVLNSTNEKYSLDQVAQLLRDADLNGNGVIDKNEGFTQILREMRITLNAQETRSLLRILEATDDGFKIDAFLDFLAPEVPAARVKTIEKAYSALQPDSNGDVKIDDLVKTLSKEGNVDFLGRRMTEQHFRSEISRSFDYDNDGIIHRNNFVSYFKEYSKNYPTDEEWNELMENLFPTQ